MNRISTDATLFYDAAIDSGQQLKIMLSMPDLPSKELEALFVENSEQAIDSILRSCLESIVGFTRDGKLVTKSAFLKLPDTAKIIAILLARQAMTRLHVVGASSA